MSIRPGAQPPDGTETKIVFLAGAVEHWWYGQWDTPEHWEYLQWRHDVEVALVSAGYLVYKHFDAFKGTWTERAQRINEYALAHSDLMLIMTSEDIPSPGTDKEIIHARNCRVPVVRVTSSEGVRDLVLTVDAAFGKVAA